MCVPFILYHLSVAKWTDIKILNVFILSSISVRALSATIARPVGMPVAVKPYFYLDVCFNNVIVVIFPWNVVGFTDRDL